MIGFLIIAAWGATYFCKNRKQQYSNKPISGVSSETLLPFFSDLSHHSFRATVIAIVVHGIVRVLDSKKKGAISTVRFIGNFYKEELLVIARVKRWEGKVSQFGIVLCTLGHRSIGPRD